MSGNGRGIALCLAALLVSATAAAPGDAVDWDRVKRMWHRLSSQERAAYDEQMRELRRSVRTIALRQLAPGAAPDDTCDDADFSRQDVLPFMDTNDTTGLGDFINLGAFGQCAAGGPQFTGTGFGPDLIYRIVVDVDCDLTVTMSPDSVDLALYVVSDCLDAAVTCFGVDDAGGMGVPESVTFSAIADVTYFVVVDGFNNSEGSFALDISGAGCMLVPVELQQFTID